ncbi:hypothetical protein RHIZO_03018 [Rhizobiaceae bacterium]|nr:hypothetical protein RHIZO_03018 [Rhizobiaceae bacterium]
MQTTIVLTDINHSSDTSSSMVRFSIRLNDAALAWLDTSVLGHVDDGEAFEATMRNRIHEITELLDDWIRQGRGIVRA